MINQPGEIRFQRCCSRARIFLVAAILVTFIDAHGRSILSNRVTKTKVESLSPRIYQKSDSVIFRNQIFMEFAGSCVYPYSSWQTPWLHFSFNYERLMISRAWYSCGLRIGSNLPFGSRINRSFAHVAVVMLNIQIGRRKTKFEPGIGFNLSAQELNYSDLRITFAACLAVRFKPIHGRIPIRLVYAPLIGRSNGKIDSSPYFGLSVGYLFNP